MSSRRNIGGRTEEELVASIEHRRKLLTIKRYYAPGEVNSKEITAAENIIKIEEYELAELRGERPVWPFDNGVRRELTPAQRKKLFDDLAALDRRPRK